MKSTIYELYYCWSLASLFKHRHWTSSWIAGLAHMETWITTGFLVEVKPFSTTFYWPATLTNLFLTCRKQYLFKFRPKWILVVTSNVLYNFKASGRGWCVINHGLTLGKIQLFEHWRTWQTLYLPLNVKWCFDLAYVLYFR